MRPGGPWWEGQTPGPVSQVAAGTRVGTGWVWKEAKLETGSEGTQPLEAGRRGGDKKDPFLTRCHSLFIHGMDPAPVSERRTVSEAPCSLGDTEMAGA